MTRCGNVRSGQTTANNQEVISYVQTPSTKRETKKSKKYITTKQNEALVKLSQQIVAVGKGEQYTQLTIDGNYTTKDLVTNNAYITIIQKPTTLEFLEHLNEDDLKQNLEEIYKSISQATAKLLDILIYKWAEQRRFKQGNHNN